MYYMPDLMRRQFELFGHVRVKIEEPRNWKNMKALHLNMDVVDPVTFKVVGTLDPVHTIPQCTFSELHYFSKTYGLVMYSMQPNEKVNSLTKTNLNHHSNNQLNSGRHAIVQVMKRN